MHDRSFGQLGPRPLDQIDQHLARALEFGVCLLAGELELLAGDLGVGGDRCELSVNSLSEIRHQIAQLSDI